MKRTSPRFTSKGPFRADQLRPGDPYELSHGHPILCLPMSSRGSKAASLGGRVLASDPAVQDVGVDTGFSPSPDILRAPDLSVGVIPDEPGWVQGVPPLAVEYADTGQDEAELRAKIQELLAAGTRYVWVVRLTGPRRVEVHQPGQGMRILNPGERLEAPGILANPVPVEALYDGGAAREVIFRNLLERQGYASLEDVRAEGEVESLREAVCEVLAARGFTVGDDLKTALANCTAPAVLRAVLRQSAVTSSVSEILTALRD